MMLPPVAWKLPGRRLIVAIWAAFGTDNQRQRLEEIFRDDDRMRLIFIEVPCINTVYCNHFNANTEGRHLG